MIKFGENLRKLTSYQLGSKPYTGLTKAGQTEERYTRAGELETDCTMWPTYLLIQNIDSLPRNTQGWQADTNPGCFQNSEMHD